MKPRATHALIAEHAGVSLGTVDRVLNERGGVQLAKAEAVLAAARALGYRGLAQSSWLGTRRIEVLLPRNPTPFWRMLDAEVQRIARRIGRHYTVQRNTYAEGDLDSLQQAIVAPPASREALIIAADAGEPVRAPLQRLVDRGTRVVTLTTEVPGLAGHVHAGVDNLALGRTAAQLMRGMLHAPGEVLVLVSQDRRVEHRQRLAGFLAAIGDSHAVQVAWTEKSLQGQAAITREALAGGRLRGIYDASHDAPEMAPLLRGAPRRPVWIAHECSPFHRAAVCEGLIDFILDQDAGAQAAYAMQAALDAEDASAAAVELRIAKPPRIHILCRANLPPPAE